MREETIILIIDDEEIMRNLLTDVLTDADYKVVSASTGQEGIEYVKKSLFDLVITDLKMPDIDGIKVIEEIKKIDPEIMTIVITGYASIETAQAALRQGAFDYIVKPFKTEKLIFTVSRAIKSKKLTEAHKELMKELINQKVKLEEEIEDLSVLYKIKQEISATLELNSVLKIIVERAVDLLDAEICSLLLINPSNGELTIQWSHGLDKYSVETTKLKTNEGISGWVAEHNEPILVEDLEDDPRFNKRKQELYYTDSFISTPLVLKDEVIGVINGNKKRLKNVFTNHDLKLLYGVANEASVAIEHATLYKDLQDKYMYSIVSLAKTVDNKIKYTKNHSTNVSKYAVAIAQRLGLSKKEVEAIKQAGILHDLGKIVVPDYILAKKDKLTDKEWNEVKKHSLKSAEIIKPLDFLGKVSKIVQQHHERYGGKGYPNGVKKENICIGARILAVADAFDAMTTERPYRNNVSTPREAINELKNSSGTQFDPRVVETLIKLMQEEPELFKK